MDYYRAIEIDHQYSLAFSCRSLFHSGAGNLTQALAEARAIRIDGQDLLVY